MPCLRRWGTKIDMKSALHLRPFRPVKPGEILQEGLDARGWTQADLAEIFDQPIQVIDAIIIGERAIMSNTPMTLSRALRTSPKYWLNLESAYRLDLLHTWPLRRKEKRP
jgi:addiction module HigA family antidote